ncbi:MAG: AMP-binding protein [Acidimicrobiales bacterium]
MRSGPSLPPGSSPTLLGLLEGDPDRIAVRTASGDTAYSYAELVAASARAGDQLRAAGTGPGAAVGLSAPNSIEFVLGLFGIASAGAVAAPLDPRLTASEIETRLADIGARALVTPSGISRRDPARSVSLPDEAALIMFTAGTTGRSKAVPWTFANVSASLRGIIRSLELTAEDATVAIMPLTHGHGLMTGLLATLATGGTVTLPEVGRFSASRFWAEMVGAGATWYTAVPTIHQILLARAAQEYPGPDRLRLRVIRSCSAPLAEPVATSIEATFHAPIVGAYGMTETAHQATSVPVGEARRGRRGSVGVPTSVEVRIRDGEVLVRGDALTAGYLNDDDADRSAFADGWFATGDLGRVDDDGYLWLTGRIKELINRGGEKIAPGAVEAALLANAAVVDAAAFGVPDPTYGERVEAAVAVTPGTQITEAELRSEVADRLSAAEVPDRILLLEQLPHTAKGAPDRRALIALAT